MNYSQEQFEKDMNLSYWLQLGCVFLLTLSVGTLLISFFA